MLRQEVWRKSIGCTSLLDYAYAESGVAPFFDKPVPEVRKEVKILFNGFYGAIGILSTDPAVKTAKDLNGKRLALGKISQAHWGGLAQTLLQGRPAGCEGEHGVHGHRSLARRHGRGTRPIGDHAARRFA